MENEIWKEITGYEGYYQVSNLGRVMGKTRNVPSYNQYELFTKLINGQILKQSRTSAGYYMVTLNRNKRKIFLVHRLVAHAFLPNKDNKQTINHINGIKTDNRVENLEWATYSENRNHAYQIGLINNAGGGSNLSKLNEKQVRVIKWWKVINPKIPQLCVARFFGVSKGAIDGIWNKNNWKHIKI